MTLDALISAVKPLNHQWENSNTDKLHSGGRYTLKLEYLPYKLMENAPKFKFVIVKTVVYVHLNVFIGLTTLNKSQ